jgi:hypothetical protein
MDWRRRASDDVNKPRAPLGQESDTELAGAKKKEKPFSSLGTGEYPGRDPRRARERRWVAPHENEVQELPRWDQRQRGGDGTRESWITQTQVSLRALDPRLGRGRKREERWAPAAGTGRTGTAPWRSPFRSGI